MTRSFQDLRAFERLTVLDNVALGVPDQFGEHILRLPAWLAVRRAERKTLDRAEACLSFVGMEAMCGRLAGSLSFAEQKLMSFAQLLATDADVLLLDKPTAGVDLAAVEKVIAVVQALRARGAAVCVVEHSIHVVGELANLLSSSTREPFSRVARSTSSPPARILSGCISVADLPGTPSRRSWPSRRLQEARCHFRRLALNGDGRGRRNPWT